MDVCLSLLNVVAELLELNVECCLLATRGVRGFALRIACGILGGATPCDVDLLGMHWGRGDGCVARCRDEVAAVYSF
jgi:hypothetical protein